MIEYICIESCQVGGLRYKVGQPLRSEHYPENPEEQTRIERFFRLPADARLAITENLYRELGLDPKKEKQLAAKLMGMKNVIDNRMSLGQVGDGIDFSRLTYEESKNMTRKYLCEEIERQFGFRVNPVANSKKHIWELGREAVRRDRPPEPGEEKPQDTEEKESEATEE